MDRGFACVSLDSPRDAENIGGVLRACLAYKVSQLTISNCRSVKLNHRANTSKAHRHMPVYHTQGPLSFVPMETKIIAVDLVPDAVSLVDYKHPERAMYVFGPESGTLAGNVLDYADDRVMIPTRGCMNLASAVQVVLYDRMAKQRRKVKENET